MNQPATVDPKAPPPASSASADVSGQNRLLSSVLFSWAAHFVLIVSGFIVPRLINDHLGAASLGVWDFGWSLVSYFHLVHGGVVSSINRYVARFSAANDQAGVNRAISSVFLVLVAMSTIVVLLTLGVAYAVPRWFSEQLGEQVQVAQWVVFWLGLSMTLQTLTAVFGGILTGHHRWDVHNTINGCTAIAITVAMIGCILSGLSLPWLAFVTLAGELTGRTARMLIAFRLFPQLKILPRLATWATAREMLAFGAKTYVPMVAGMLTHQTVSVLVIAFLGPVALAWFSRPRSLVRQAGQLIYKYAMVLTPTSSSLQALGDQEALGKLLIQSTRYASFIAFPMIAGFAILGGPLLRVWMGPEYERPVLLAVLAIGALPSFCHLPAQTVLTGMNAHGRPGIAKLIAAIATIPLVAASLHLLPGNLEAVALAVSLPPALVFGYYIPAYACRKLNLRFGAFNANAFIRPLACCLPFSACLIASRLVFTDQPGVSIFAGGGVGAIVLGILYWKYALSAEGRSRLLCARLPRRANVHPGCMSMEDDA